MSGPTLSWWSLLCTVALFNLLGWALSVALLRRRAGMLAPHDLALTRWQIVLSAGYVLGCGYRSVFPVFDVQRLVIVDTWLSSVIVGRSGGHGGRAVLCGAVGAASARCLAGHAQRGGAGHLQADPATDRGG
jgi:hypothetical protein